MNETVVIVFQLSVLGLLGLWIAVLLGIALVKTIRWIIVHTHIGPHHH